VRVNSGSAFLVACDGIYGASACWLRHMKQ